MVSGIDGLHHVTALASDAVRNNRFYTRVLGLRRVKKTVNFDKPEVYHLYYGDTLGAAGSVMTFFPMSDARPGQRGAGEVSRTLFAVPQGALGFWRARFAVHGVRVDEALSGVRCLAFQGPDGEALGLVEVAHDTRDPHVTPEIPAATAIRGFYGARLTLRKVGPTATLLRFMGYRDAGRDGAMHRFALPHGNGADHIDLIEDADAPDAVQGAGSVHHLAFAVRDRKTQNRVRTALVQAGHRVTEVMDRSYFYAIYFRAPCGVLFEIATACPGFDADEDRADLGRALKLPEQHEHMRGWLQDRLVPLDA